MADEKGFWVAVSGGKVPAREPTAREWSLAFEGLAALVRDEYPGNSLAEQVRVFANAPQEVAEAIRVADEYLDSLESPPT